MASKSMILATKRKNVLILQDGKKRCPSFMCGAGYSVQSYKKPSMAPGNSRYLLHSERFQFSFEPGPQPMFQLFPFLTCCLQLNQGLLHLLHLLNIDLLLFELKQRKKMQRKLNNENK